jgi:hypothetical protein
MGISSAKVRELAKRAMGHSGEALEKVDKIMGAAGLSPDLVSTVHGLLQKVDLTALVVDGDTARASLVDVEKVVLGVVAGEKDVVKGVAKRFVASLDTDGDGHVSKTEIAAATVKFGSVAKALAAAQVAASKEAPGGGAPAA